MNNPKQKCKYCDSYLKEGHNYCRMCGYHLTKGFSQNPRVAVAYNTDERYCGNCGKLRKKCDC